MLRGRRPGSSFFKTLRACTRCWPCQRTALTHLPNCWPCQHRYCLRAPRRPPWLLFLCLCEQTRNVGPANESRNPTFQTAGPANTSTRSLPCAAQNHVRSPRQDVVLKWCCRLPLREAVGPASGKNKLSMTMLSRRA